MKKLLFVFVLGAFAACGGGESSSTSDSTSVTNSSSSTMSTDSAQGTMSTDTTKGAMSTDSAKTTSPH